MRLVSIISTWTDSLCILPHCISNHLKFCDAVIVVGSIKSNHGVSSDAYQKFIDRYPFGMAPNNRVIFEFCEPAKGFKPLGNETRKRNHGLAIAKAMKFDLFLIADADEFYEPEKMKELKGNFPYVEGYVHPIRAYITPTLYCEDHTLVCGMHRLHKDVFCGNYPYYPFAYDKKNVARIDPSRRLPFRNFIHLSDVVCHHYTLVRKDIDLKINNSTANSLRHNREVIYNEIRDAKPGYISKLYHQELKETENIFNIQI